MTGQVQEHEKGLTRQLQALEQGLTELEQEWEQAHKTGLRAGAGNDRTGAKA